MKGYLIDQNGTEYELPKLLSWDVCHGLGESCDFFELCCVYDSGMLAALESATKFRGKNGNDTVFYGVVDEYIISIDDKGSTVSINGRSLAAVLMDNEVSGSTYYSISKDTLIDNFISPYGISDIADCNMQDVLLFPVIKGDSAWSVVKRFCLRSAHCEPRFGKTGKLLLTETQGTAYSLDGDTECVGMKYRDCRYGVITNLSVVSRSSGNGYDVSDQEMLARGGKCRRFLYTDMYESVISNPADVGERFVGLHEIAKSKEGKNCVEVTVPTQFFCFPGDKVNFDSSILGLSGQMKVLSTHCWADSYTAGTVIKLEV